MIVNWKVTEGVGLELLLSMARPSNLGSRYQDYLVNESDQIVM